MSATDRHSVWASLYRLGRLAGWFAASTVRIARLRSPQQRDAVLQQAAEGLLTTLNLSTRVNCHAQCPARPPVLAVANHVSWLDIFVLLALYPSGFIAKQSIRRWPLVGPLAARAGTVFINRNSRQDTHSVNQSIAAALTQGQSVTFFPEARTSDGMGVLPFKAALFQAAIDTCTPVQAMALRYYTDSGQRCADAAWVGNTSFYRSVWRIVRLRRIEVQVDFAPLMGPDFTCHADRFQIKEAAEQFIRHKVDQP